MKSYFNKLTRTKIIIRQVSKKRWKTTVVYPPSVVNGRSYEESPETKRHTSQSSVDRLVKRIMK